MGVIEVFSAWFQMFPAAITGICLLVASAPRMFPNSRVQLLLTMEPESRITNTARGGSVANTSAANGTAVMRGDGPRTTSGAA